jgi:RHS repeat-associated protein
MRRMSSIVVRSSKRAQGTRRLRRIALVAVVVFGLSTVVPADAVPAGGGFPVSWLWSWLDVPPGWSSAGTIGVPAQPGGTAEGKAHYVSAAATDAGRGAGRAPGQGIGALDPYTPPVPDQRRSKAPARPGDQSFDPKTSVRIASAGSATSDVYRNTGGSYTRKVFDGPVNYRAADGSWHPIDSTLSRDTSGRYRQKANGMTLDVARLANDSALVSMRLDSGHAVSYSLVGAAASAAVVSGDTAEYRNVLPGTDLRLASTASGVKESLVLRSADVATSWLFPLDLQGLTPRLEPDGSVSLRDASGTSRARIPGGLVRDSTFDAKAGEFTTSRKVTYELTTSGGAPALRVSIDQAWLRDPKRTFPVTVDPTTTFADSSDTYTRSDQSGDHSREDELLAGTYNGGMSKTYSFLHFTTFDTTYAGAKFSSVSLKIFDSWAGSCTPEPFNVNPINAAWSTTMTTYPGPAFGASIGSVTADPGVACTNTSGDRSVGTWMTVPLNTATFQNWVLGRTANNGLAVTASQTDNTQWKRFTSHDGPSLSLAPYLQVTYSPGVAPQVDGQYPQSGYAVSTLTPELLVAAHDPDAYPNALTYDFALFDRNATKLADSGWTSSRNWVVPEGKLTWGQDYQWTVTASDGYYGSTSQTTNVFSTPVPQPLITSGLAQNGDQGFEPSVGNYTTVSTDATVSTIGPALAIERSYNSQDPRLTDAFGAGWSSIVDVKATDVKDTAGAVQTVIVTYPGGQEVAFGRSPNGSFAPPSGRFATFTAVTGGYQLVDKDATTYTFTAVTGTAGQYGVSSIADAQGRTESFGYDASHRLTTITSASGRALHLTWSTPADAAAAHVATVVTDPATAGDTSTAATWTYSYSGDQLTKACPPTSSTACLSYSYTTGSQYPSAVLNAGPRSYWRMAETSGTVAASQVLDNQGTDNAIYNGVTLGQTGPLPGSSAKAAAFNGTSSSMKLPGKLVASASYQSVGLWFKANAGDSGPLFSYQADPITSATTAGNYTPALYVGTSGKLYGKFWDGSAATPMAATGSVANGAWHHVMLVGAGDAQWLYLDGALAASRTGLIKTLNDYSATNEYIGAGFLGGLWPDQAHYSTSSNTGYASSFKGSIAEVSFFDRPLTAANVAAITNTGKVAAKPLTSVVRPSGNPTVSIAYDGVSSKVSQVTDSNGGMWKINNPTVSGSYQSYSAAVLSAGPADYWRLAESGTSDAVNEVNGNTATYSNVTLGVAGGPFDDPAVPSDNTAVAGFDGSSSYLQLPSADVPATGPTSVSLWFKMPAGSTAGGVLFGYQTGAVEDPAASTYWTPAIYVGTDGKLRGQVWTGSKTPITSTGTVNNGAWHHVVLAAGTNTQSLYLDGTEVGNPLNAPLVATSAQQAFVGAGKWTTWPGAGASAVGMFPGQIAEVSYYRTQLTAGQVSAQFAARDKAAGLPAKTVTITDPGNKTISHTYELTTGNELAETDALGNRTQYGYDTGGFLRTVTDPNGDVTTTEHDVRGNAVSQTTCQDRSANKCSTVYFSYYPDATTSVLTPDPRNDAMLTTRDARSASPTDNTYLTSYTYDAKGNRTQITDPLGRKATTEYTDGTTIPAVNGGYAPAGLPYTTTTAGGAVQKVDYYANGDVARTTDPGGKVTTYAYDGLGRVISQTETTDSYPSELTTTYTYDKAGRALSQTEPAVTSRVTGAVHTPVTTTTYDVDGLVTSETVSDSTGGDAARRTSNTYNAHGLVDTTTDAAGKVTTFGYDAYGNQVKEIDADGGEIDSEYDAEGRLLTETMVGYTGDPNNPSPPKNLVILSNAYDPSGRLASETDAMGWVTSHTYTDNGLDVQVTRSDPASGASFVQEDNSYDAAGNLVAQTTNNGATTTTFTVDAANRTTSSTLDPSGLKRTSTFEYSADDFQVAETVSDPSGVLSKSETMYDPMGREIAFTQHNGAMAPMGWWKLNETAGGTAKDSAGNSPATATNVTWSTDRGGAGTFNGTSSEIATNTPVVDTARSFTVAAWVKLADNTTIRKAVGAAGEQQDAFELRYDNDINKWRFVMKYADVANAGGTAANSTSAPALNTWTHLVGVYDASTDAMSLYVNGTREGSATNTTPFTTQGPLLIGAGIYNNARANHWSGGISDVQVYSRALSTSEVASVYGGNAPAADAGVIRTSQVLDQDGLATAVTDPNGNTTTYAYDEAGQEVVTTAPAVMTETNGGTPVLTRAVSYTGYDTFGEDTESKDPNGNVTVTAYDAAGRDVSTTLPSYTPPDTGTPVMPVVKKEYDPLGQVISETDPLGNVTRYSYDQLGRVAKVTGPDLAESTFTYDANGDQLSATDPTGAQTTATYDHLGRQVTSTEVVRQDNTAYTTNYTYDGHGWLASVKAPSGVTSSTSYNAVGEPVTVIDPAGNTAVTGYDGLGRPVRVTLPDGTYTTTTLDMAGRAVATAAYNSSGVLQAQQSSAYDDAGNVVAATDARHTTTTFSYDATGLLSSMTEPISASDSITSTFGYDMVGNRTRFTNGRGNAFITTYNRWNLPESQIEPATATYPNAADRTFTASYDAAGHLSTMTSPGGVKVTYDYDTVGRVTRQSGSGALVATVDRIFGYDTAGRMRTAAGSAGTETFGYDDRGDLRSATGAAGDSSFTYNADGEMASRTDAAGTTDYGYDPAGRLRSVSNTTGGVQATYAYDNLSQVNKITYGTNGNSRSFGYDVLHRLTSDELKTSGGTSIAKITYGYDANGNETSKTTSGFAGSATNAYTYDLADRLTSWDNGTTVTPYAYDKAGNRVQTGSKIFGYDQRNQLTTQVDNGTTTNYQYTARGTLASTTGSTGVANTVADAFNQITSQGATSTDATTYTYDGLGRAIRPGFSYSGTSNTLAADGTATYTRDPDDDLLGVADGTAKTLAWTDQHDDVVAQFGAGATALAGSTTYDPLGNVLAFTTMLGHLGYQSEWTDTLTKRVNMLARWYNPDSGQFDTRDTVGLNPVPNSIEANRFEYGSANPLTTTDPTGHFGVPGWNKAKHLGSKAKHAGSTAWGYTKRGYHATTSFLTSSYNYGRDRTNEMRDITRQKLSQARRVVARKVADVAHATTRVYHRAKRVYHQARHYYHQARKYVAHTYHHAKQRIKRSWHQVRQAGRHVMAKAHRAVRKIGHAVRDAYKSSVKYVKEHKKAIIEIGAVVAGVAAGFACTAATAGAGAVACMVGASALINVAKDAAEGNIHSFGDTLGSLSTGAAQGLMGVAGGAAGGKIASMVVGKLGTAAATVGGRMLAGGIAGGIGDAAIEMATTGHVSWTGVALGVGIGAVTGGFLKQRGCHSFDPNTRVAMADGTVRPIKDINVGDKVKSTDTKTGKTTAKPVTMLHRNKDTDLTDVTVKTPSGVNTLHTTAHHPFWDATDRTWVDAAKLKVGHKLRTVAGLALVAVLAVTPVQGKQLMDDLTVSDNHAYYVVAGDTPVLVHNCDDGDGHLYRGVPQGHPMYEDALQGRAVPRGGHSDPGRHAGGNTDSQFTSWTHDYEGVALDAAEELGPGGIVMRIPHSRVPPAQDVKIHGTDYETYEESEHALRGIIGGAEISINRGPWTRPSR